jgi:hypothetical protein
MVRRVDANLLMRLVPLSTPFQRCYRDPTIEQYGYILRPI